tara:strand:+ start:875 stop:1366 length:492 start_codon:yes stop_codon:yes gene_type:complete
MKTSHMLLKQLKKLGFDISGELIDAPKPMSIYISEKDISKGVSTNPLKCTAAQCIQRAFDTKKVAMFMSACYVQMPESSDVIRYIVPQSVRIKVVKPQDNGGAPISGWYTLRAPFGDNRLGAIHRKRQHIKDLVAKGLLPKREPKNAWKKASPIARDAGRWGA